MIFQLLIVFFFQLFEAKLKDLLFHKFMWKPQNNKQVIFVQIGHDIITHILDKASNLKPNKNLKEL